ncbi:ATP-binding cassette domain-containing protein [Streptomyces stramineus]
MPVTTLPARERAQLTCAGIRVERGGRTVLRHVALRVSPRSRWGVVGENGRGKSTLLHVLAGTLTPDEGSVHRVGTLALAEQEVPAEDDRTVGDVVDEHLADVRAALRRLDDATADLAAQRSGAEDAYADALEAAQALDAWDADRRVDVALDGLGAVSDRSAPWPRCRSASATGSGWPACWAPGTISCCWTSRPITSTWRHWSTSPPGCAPTRAASSWSATTGRSCRTWSPRSSTSIRPATAVRASTAADTPAIARAARPSGSGGPPSTSSNRPSTRASRRPCPKRRTA